MSNNEDATDSSDQSLDRRKFMSALGAAGGAAAFAPIVGEADAAEGSAAKAGLDIKELDGKRAENMVEKIKRQEEYGILSNYLESEKRTLVDDSEAQVYSYKDEDEPGVAYLCSLPLTTSEGESIEKAGISVELRRGRIQSMIASRAENLDDDIYDVTLQTVSNGDVEESTMTVDAKEMASQV